VVLRFGSGTGISRSRWPGPSHLDVVAVEVYNAALPSCCLHRRKASATSGWSAATGVDVLEHMFGPIP